MSDAMAKAITLLAASIDHYADVLSKKLEWEKEQWVESLKRRQENLNKSLEQQQRALEVKRELAGKKGRGAPRRHVAGDAQPNSNENRNPFD